MGFAERSLAAAGAAVVSAVLVNPLDVAKVRTVVWSGAAAGPALSLSPAYLGRPWLRLALRGFCKPPQR